MIHAFALHFLSSPGARGRAPKLLAPEHIHEEDREKFRKPRSQIRSGATYNRKDLTTKGRAKPQPCGPTYTTEQLARKLANSFSVTNYAALGYSNHFFTHFIHFAFCVF